MAKMNGSFVKKYAQSLIALIVALVVLFWTLNFLHTRMAGNILGRTAGTVGDLASGQKYSFTG